MLVNRHQAAVGRAVIRMLGPGDDADDVAQETFIRFHRALAEFRGDAELGTYLTRIAINLSLNALRRRKWQLRRFVRRDIAATDSIQEPHVLPSEDVLTLERRAQLENALGKLNDEQRAVVVLRMLEEYSTRETAEMLRVPEGTVMSRLTRALANMQHHLRDSGLEAE